VAGCCDHSNETSWSIKGGKFLDYLSYTQLLKKELRYIHEVRCVTYEVVSKSFRTAWSENCKWHSSLPLCAVVSLFCGSV
jgi:hypothetical protein